MRSLSMAAAALALSLSAPAFAETVTIETATGPAEAPLRPETVVAFDVAAIDTLEALGVTLAGVPDPIYLPYLDDVTASAEKVGTLFEPDFEKLAILGPDLIIAGGRSSSQVAALSQIAPTLDMTIWGGDMVAQAKARVTAYGTLFGHEDEAAALDAALDAKIAEVRQAVAGKGAGLILLTNGGKISAYGDDSRFGWLHTATGLPEAYPDVSSETHGESVSFEFLAEIDPDWLLVIDRGAAINAAGEAASATLDNPLVNGTKAAKNGHILYLQPGPLYIAGGGIQSMMGTLDELLTAFSAVES